MHKHHTHHPADGSYNERIKALKSALKFQHTLEVTLQLKNERKWANRIGSTEELQFAQESSKNTLQASLADFSASELKNAFDSGAFSVKDQKTIKMARYEEQLKQFRETQRKHKNSGPPLKR